MLTERWPRRRIYMLLRIAFLAAFLLPINLFAQSKSTQQIVNQDDLLAALITAASAEESNQLLTSHRNLITAKLCDRLLEKGIEYFDKSDYGKSLSLYEAANVCATELNDKTRSSGVLHRIGKVYYEQ